MKLAQTVLCTAAVLAVAGMAATATAAQRNKPALGTTTTTSTPAVNAPLTWQQKKALGEQMALKQRGYQPPQTEAQARKTIVRRPGNQLSSQVPVSLWSHLHAQKDAEGNLHMVETDSDTAPVTIAEGLDNE